MHLYGTSTNPLTNPICQYWWEGPRWYSPISWWHNWFCKRCAAAWAEKHEFEAQIYDVVIRDLLGEEHD